MPYKDYQRDLAPPWLKDPDGTAWLEAHGEEKDALVDQLVAAVKAFLVDTAPEDALMLLGAERGLERFDDEPLDAYRDRVRGAPAFWAAATTIAGIEAAIRQLGYVPGLIEMFKTTPAAWDEFVPVLHPGTKFYGTPQWSNDGNWEDDGTRWGLDISAKERARIKGVLGKVKPARAIHPRVLYAETGFVWGEGGNWQDDGLWEEARVTAL